uniref:Transthyretin-like family-containing protein n=1 Tax=Strongyloides venezuelensis TaxID=75913 RepID=A0A0K0FTV3_STRVS
MEKCKFQLYFLTFDSFCIKMEIFCKNHRKIFNGNSKFFLILITILAYKITVKCLPFSVYSTGVVGKLKCSFKKGRYSNPLVLISEKNHIIKEKNPIASLRVKLKTFFRISGNTRTYFKLRKPKLYVKIIHDCFVTKNQCKKVIVKQISPEFVRRGYVIFGFFSLGYLDLARTEGKIMSYDRNSMCF